MLANHVRKVQTDEWVKRLRAKTNFGKFYSLASERPGSWDWLKEGKLGPQNEAFVTVIQNRALKTREAYPKARS